MIENSLNPYAPQHRPKEIRLKSKEKILEIEFEEERTELRQMFFGFPLVFL